MRTLFDDGRLHHDVEVLSVRVSDQSSFDRKGTLLRAFADEPSSPTLRQEVDVVLVSLFISLQIGMAAREEQAVLFIQHRRENRTTIILIPLLDDASIY